jgi:hypothetical protein
MHLIRGLLLGALAIAAVQVPAPSVLQSDPKGWVDLLADKTLKNWVRVPMPGVGKLPAGNVSDPSPWMLDSSGEVLICEGGKVGREMFRYREELGDFVLHAEWRFTKLDGEPAYNSGVFVRTSADGTTWFQGQTTLAGGFLLGSAVVGGQAQRVNLREKMVENRVKPAGEWNTYEIKAVGRTLALWVNGMVVNEYTECDVPRGYVGLEAEGYRIEFRNLKLKKF